MSNWMDSNSREFGSVLWSLVLFGWVLWSVVVVVDGASDGASVAVFIESFETSVPIPMPVLQLVWMIRVLQYIQVLRMSADSIAFTVDFLVLFGGGISSLQSSFMVHVLLCQVASKGTPPLQAPPRAPTQRSSIGYGRRRACSPIGRQQQSEGSAPPPPDRRCRCLCCDCPCRDCFRKSAAARAAVRGAGGVCTRENLSAGSANYHPAMPTTSCL